MSSTVPVRLRVTIVTGHGDVGILLPAHSSDRVSDVVARLVRELGLTGGPAGWQLHFTDRTLPGDRLLRDVVPSALDPIPLTLRMVGSPNQRPSGGPGGLPVPPAPDTEPARELAPALTPTDRARSGARGDTGSQATVSYYSRMNPSRVFPLTVTLTRDEVAQLVQRNVQPRGTGPLKIGADSPLEIEPVLPGCEVHPAKIVTRLGNADGVFRFHVIPHVVGAIPGARVVIRQDHATLAEIEIDARVTQQTWVWLTGFAAVALPVASSAMSQAGVDFHSAEGFKPVLAMLRFLFSDVPPIVLGTVLATLTGVVWALTRPKPHDLFWDAATQSAAAK
jgi:hypothetical protein